MPGRPPILVVGAGPTGLVAALLLARLGVATIVLERRVEPQRGPRAVHLDGGSVRILQRAGVGDGFAALSRPAAGLRLLDARLRPFAVFPRAAGGAHGWPESNLFDQPELEELLRAEVARQPLVRLRPGVELEAVAPAAEVHAMLRDVRTGRREVLSGSALLGCDGASSTVRAAIGARWRDLGYTQRWFVVDVRSARPPATWGGVDQVCDPRRAATFMALAGNRYRWEFRMRAGETAEGLVARLDELTARWRPPVGLEVVRAAEYTFRARLADRWRDGRVLLLGDAAHLTPPFIGQGLGLGLRDAHNLAWRIASGENRWLPGYERERAPHAEAVIRGAVRIGRAMTGGQGVAAAVRRPVVAGLLRVPGVRARAARGIEERYPAGARGLTGTCCPQPTVGVAGRPTRLDEVLGDGFALLGTGPVPRALRERAAGLGARTIHIGPSNPDRRVDAVVLDDGDGTLRGWLHRGGAVAALLRPDRFVLATAPR